MAWARIPIEYFSDTWHTNLDTYERIIPDDVQKDAVLVASAIYQLAMRDDILPRFAKADMPPKPESEGAQAASSQPATNANGSKQTPDASGQPAGKGPAHKK